MNQSVLFAMLACLMVQAACNPSKKGTDSHSGDTTMVITGKKWKLTELYGKPVADAINGKMPFLQLDTTDSRYTGTAGCNGMGGEFTLSGSNGIAFSRGMSTMMACEEMWVETELGKALLEADNFTVNGDTLSLNKARMAPLARFRWVKEEEAAASQLNGTWEVDYVSGPRIAFEGLYPDKKPTITFNLPDTRATGTGSCNQYSTTFVIEGNAIRFADAASTKMACEGNGEAVFFKTLKTVDKYSVAGGTLNLIMGDIAVMRLQKKQ